MLRMDKVVFFGEKLERRRVDVCGKHRGAISRERQCALPTDAGCGCGN
jgi:hypothetical protein